MNICPSFLEWEILIVCCEISYSTAMKILHTSDWHLGRQFHNVSLLDDQAHILDQIYEIIQQHKVDVVLIAGDIYDHRQMPFYCWILLSIKSLTNCMCR